MDSGPVTADVMVVLGGTPDRAHRAAELFQAGAAPKILVTGFGDDLSNERILESNGVPASAITIEPNAHTTRENALYSIPLLHALGAKRVIIVTSWYHSRRGLCCFEHYAPDLQFYSRPSYFGYIGENPEKLRTEKLTGSNFGISKPSGSNISISAFQHFRLSETRAQWRAVRGYANAEYVKLVGYWVCYGVAPF